jgi:hypothetical protein
MTDTFGFPINATPRKIILDVHLHQPLVGQAGIPADGSLAFYKQECI